MIQNVPQTTRPELFRSFEVTQEKVRMRIPVLLTTIMSVVLSLVGSNHNATVLAGESVAPAARAMAAVRFSSSYTALTKCGSGMTKKEEQEAEEHGSDIPTRCKGFSGYDVYVYYSACSSHISLDRGDESIPLATQAVDWKQKTVEWRMANGRPFAIIMRVYEYSGDDQCSAGGKIIGESLMIKGLKGFEHIDEEFKVKGTPNPNAKARQIADKGYASPRRT